MDNGNNNTLTQSLTMFSIEQRVRQKKQTKIYGKLALQIKYLYIENIASF